jgi:hypothetical protein
MRCTLRLFCGIFLALTTNAFAGIAFPTGGFSCSFNKTPFFGSDQITDCTPGGGATSVTGNPDIAGVSLGMASAITWTVTGSGAGGDQIAIPNPGGLENQGNVILMQTSGIVGGSGTFTGYMPLHYDFTIESLSGPSCIASDPCGMNVSWSLALRLDGAAVTGGEVALPVVHGSGVGHFTGDALLPSGFNPKITVLPMTITAGLDMTVSGSLILAADSFPSDATASFSVIIPTGASFDFNAPASVPEPAGIGLMAAGLLALAYRKFTSRF